MWDGGCEASYVHMTLADYKFYSRFSRTFHTFIDTTYILNMSFHLVDDRKKRKEMSKEDRKKNECSDMNLHQSNLYAGWNE